MNFSRMLKPRQESDFRRHLPCFQNPLLFLGIGRPQASLAQIIRKRSHGSYACANVGNLIDDLVYMADLLSEYKRQKIVWQLKIGSKFPLEYVRQKAASQYD